MADQNAMNVMPAGKPILLYGDPMAPWAGLGWPYEKIKRYLKKHPEAVKMLCKPPQRYVRFSPRFRPSNTKTFSPWRMLAVIIQSRGTIVHNNPPCHRCNDEKTPVFDECISARGHVHGGCASDQWHNDAVKCVFNTKKGPLKDPKVVGHGGTVEARHMDIIRDMQADLGEIHAAPITYGEDNLITDPRLARKLRCHSSSSGEEDEEEEAPVRRSRRRVESDDSNDTVQGTPWYREPDIGNLENKIIFGVAHIAEAQSSLTDAGNNISIHGIHFRNAVGVNARDRALRIADARLQWARYHGVAGYYKQQFGATVMFNAPPPGMEEQDMGAFYAQWRAEHQHDGY